MPFQTNVSKSVQFYNATGLTYNTEYTIGTQTVDNKGNINPDWMNNTAKTAPDTIPPITNINLSGNLKPSGWYASYVRVELTAMDDASGVNITEYSLDDISWNFYIAPFEIKSEGNSVVQYRSIDKAGNAELTQGVPVQIDTIPPQITVEGVVDGSYYNTNVTPTITIIEPYSFIISQSITLNGKIYESGTLISDEGIYTLLVSATDAANHTSVKSVNFTVDRTPPLSLIYLNNATFEQETFNLRLFQDLSSDS